MALTTVTVHGELLNLDGLTPAVGTVTFRTLIELRDVVDNIIYPPATFTATLDLLGEFTIVLPATDNPDILPLNWVYQVYISTDTWTATQYVQLPFQPGTTEYADLVILDYDPCADVILPTPLAPGEGALYVLKAGDTMTGNLTVLASLGVTGIGTFGTEVSTPLVTSSNVNTTTLTLPTAVTAITSIDPGATGKYSAVVAAGVAAPAVRRELSNTVRLQGRIAVTAAGAVAGDVVMAVPAGFFPTDQQWLSVTTSTGVVVPCEVMPNGNVIARATAAGPFALMFETFVYKTSA